MENLLEKYLNDLKNINEDVIKESKIDAEYEKSFSQIPRDIFDSICLIDPDTKHDSDGIQKIGYGAKQLLLKSYLKGETNFMDEPEKVLDALSKYYPNRSKYPQLHQFESVKSFLDFIENPDSNEVELKKESDPVTDIYNKYYSKLDRDVFDKIISIDPKTTKDRIGEIARSLLLPAQIKGEDILKYDEDQLLSAINFFYEHKNELPTEKQNIQYYKTVNDFIKNVNSGPSKFLQDLLNNETIDPKTHRPVKDDIRVVASSRDYEILEPLSQKANNAISGGFEGVGKAGENMNWCTASDNTRQWWDMHVEHQKGRLFDFMHKTKNRGAENQQSNWQIQVNRDYHIHDSNFKDGLDRDPIYFPGNSAEERFKSFLIRYPDIYEAIKDKDPFDKMPIVKDAGAAIKYSDTIYEVNSKSNLLLLVSKELYKIVRGVKFNLDNVPSGLFSGCLNLQEVELGPNVKKIGYQAFKSCGVTKLTLNEGLEYIGKEAFATCGSLKGSVRLPDTVIEIDEKAFLDTQCNIKVNINRNNKLTISEADREWAYKRLRPIKG